MTKEKLYHEIPSYKQLLDEFFHSNVVIPKGENRHPYADVLHEWIEGAEMLELDEMLYGEPRWIPVVLDYEAEYRIKPKEPVYEWQWYDVEHVLDFSEVSTKRVRMLNNGEYMTEFEADGCTCYGLIYRFEETKKIRK